MKKKTGYMSSDKVLEWISDNDLDEEYVRFAVSLPVSMPVSACLRMFYQNSVTDDFMM